MAQTRCLLSPCCGKASAIFAFSLSCAVVVAAPAASRRIYRILSLAHARCYAASLGRCAVWLVAVSVSASDARYSLPPSCVPFPLAACDAILTCLGRHCRTSLKLRVGSLGLGRLSRFRLSLGLCMLAVRGWLRFPYHVLPSTACVDALISLGMLGVSATTVCLPRSVQSVSHFAGGIVRQSDT